MAAMRSDTVSDEADIDQLTGSMMSDNGRRHRRAGNPAVFLLGLFATLLAARIANTTYGVPGVYSLGIGLAAGTVVMISLVFFIAFIGSLLGRKPESGA